MLECPVGTERGIRNAFTLAQIRVEAVMQIGRIMTSHLRQDLSPKNYP